MFSSQSTIDFRTPAAIVCSVGLGACVAAAQTAVTVRGLDGAQDRDAILGDLEPRLVFVRERPAGPSRADDAAFFLKRVLLLRGYRDVEVDWSLPSGGGILLTTTPGSRYTIGEVNVSLARPVDTAEQDFDSYFLQPFRDRTPGLNATYPYLPNDVQAGITNLTNYLRSLGHWSATVEMQPLRFGPTSQALDIELSARPGPLHILREPILNIEGVAVPPNLRSDLQEVAGQPATAERIRSIRKTVTDTFQSLGYQFLELKMLQTNADGRTQLTFNVVTGQRFTLDNVLVTGDRKTSKSRVEALFENLEGDFYDREKTDRRVRRLLATGAFSGIRTIEEPKDNGDLDLRVELTETDPDGFNFYAGAGSLEGFIFGAGYYHRNLFGELLNFSAGVEYSGLGILTEVSLTDPLFLNRDDLRLKGRFFIITRDFDGYDKREAGISAALDWQTNDFYSLGFDYRGSYVDITPDGLTGDDLGPGSYVLNSLSLRQKYDRRNDPALPTQGYIVTLDTTLALAARQEAVAFLENNARYSYFHEFDERNHLILSARAGSIVPLNGEILPVDTRTFLGGANTVRSFPERELGPKSDNGIPRGGQSYYVVNATYLRTLAGPVRGALFFDSGGLSRGSSSFGLDDPKHALGLGLRFDLPIGPVRLEYGHALNPSGDDPDGAFHFSIGSSF